MDTNEFERRARRQAFRPVPAQWRAQILGVAGNGASDESLITHHEPRRPWWRELLWPCPQAWAGLAAVWVAILLLTAAAGRPAAVANHQAALPSLELRLALQEQKRLLVELVGPVIAAGPPPKFVPRPRSELLPRTIPV